MEIFVDFVAEESRRREEEGVGDVLKTIREGEDEQKKIPREGDFC